MCCSRIARLPGACVSRVGVAGSAVWRLHGGGRCFARGDGLTLSVSARHLCDCCFLMQHARDDLPLDAACCLRYLC